MAASRVSERAIPSKPPKVAPSNTTTKATILLTLNDIILSYPPKMRRHKLRGLRAPIAPQLLALRSFLWLRVEVLRLWLILDRLSVF